MKNKKNKIWKIKFDRDGDVMIYESRSEMWELV